MDAYILRQIKNLGTKGKYPPRLKLATENGETKWVDITWDALAKVRAILKVHDSEGI